MDINTNSVPTQAAQPNTTGSVARSKLGESFDSFLTLLTTQLQYQDPLSPMDSAEFTNQLVLFSGVEQQIAQNEKLEQLLRLQNASQTQATLGFIGLDVEVVGDRFSYANSPVDLSYIMPSGAKQAVVRIIDDSGNTVRTLTADRSPGAHAITWDGKDNNGNTVDAGSYRFLAGAIDESGKSLEVKQTVSGRITGIETVNGTPLLLMGDVLIRVEDVLAAREPSTTSNS